MVNEARKAQLENISLDYLYEQLRDAGIDVDHTRFTKAELIDRLLEEEAEPTEPTEPTGKTEPAGEEGTGEGEGEEGSEES